MIYQATPKDAPIRQGDIFVGVPRLDVSLNKVPVVTEKGEFEETSWDELATVNNPMSIIVTAQPVAAIVISQNCDASRAPDISLCEIRPFQEVERSARETKTPKSWMSKLTQHARVNQKWFYLPPSSIIGFQSKMAVDFLVTLRLRREDLENICHLRKGRLNGVASAHFRERIAEFFRRYPYDEWYALNAEEMEAYVRDHPEAKPFPWQSVV